MPILSTLLLLVGLNSVSQTEGAAAAIPIFIKAPRGPIYVGQEIPLTIQAKVELPQIQLIPNKSTDVDVELSRSSQDAGRNPSPILRVTPRRAGQVTIPVLTFRIGERTGKSRQIKLNVEVVPSLGRPAQFLGGVGSFTVESSVDRGQVKLGETFEYRIKVSGPASRGMIHQPVLRRSESDPPDFRIEPLTSEFSSDPPTRIFRYKLRAQRLGKSKLPPVSLSAFDPASRQFVTKATSRVEVVVQDIPRLDPNTLDYRLPEDPPRSELSWPALSAIGAGVVMLAISARRVRRSLRRKRSNRAIQRLTTSIRKQLAKTSNPNEAARLISEGLTEYLHHTTGRPTGALTPIEARDGVVQIDEDALLGERAERIIARCDRALFGEDGAEMNGLVGVALDFFQDLERRQKLRSKSDPEPSMSREADETTMA
ncbi:BatD family protein [Singulisphaera sp. PoT]|uniref:BatD family protein n=1 Tax=Singulisphaera sp. PoT TaxID=3411797 RepID=UPI003BF59C6C